MCKTQCAIGFVIRKLSLFCNFEKIIGHKRTMRTSYVISTLLAVIAVSCSFSSKGKDARKTNEQPSFNVEMTFNADSAYRYIERQVDFGPRVPGSDSHLNCQSYLVGELLRHGADTVLQQKTTLTAYTGMKLPINNIMGRFNEDTQKRVLLLAHWDCRPWADNDPDVDNRDKPVPGANDGASGVGVLLEIARQLNIKRPDIGVDILFVDAEDAGRSEGFGSSEDTWCLGTQYWLDNMPYADGVMPVYGILLDMVGGINARFYREYISDQYAEDLNSKVWAIAEASGYGEIFPNQQGGGIVDDHMFVNRAGIPCIDIVECSNPETGTFPPYWHTLKDDMSKIDRSRLKAVGQTVLNVIYLER